MNGEMSNLYISTDKLAVQPDSWISVDDNSFIQMTKDELSLIVAYANGLLAARICDDENLGR